MDATTIGSVLGSAGVVAAAVVAYFGKRGETAVTGYSSLTDQLQEELASKRAELTEKNVVIAEQAALRAADQAEIARLRALLIQHGGTP